MDADKLNNQINKDKSDKLNPFLLIATAGTTDTGAVDPLMEIGKIARRNKLWYHIDAAYGGFINPPFSSLTDLVAFATAWDKTIHRLPRGKIITFILFQKQII
jgi:glutamate/tyrosine decarboxylase-like PLP-dependent enzyme